MAYATSDIIQWAKASQPLAAYGEFKKNALTGAGTVDLDLHMKIYVERKSLEWQLAQDPTDSDGILFSQGNYVYALCFPYVFEAMEATGGGAVVVPGSGAGQSFPIYITQSNFSSTTLYPNTNLAGLNIKVWLNEINRYLVDGEYEVLTTGLNILLPGFDASANTYFLIIEKVVTG